MSYLVWEMWASPTYEVGESSSPGTSFWWQEERWRYVCSSLCLPSALLAVLLYKRGMSRGSVGLGPSWFCTQSRHPVLCQCLLTRHPWQWRLQAAALSREGWLG